MPYSVNRSSTSRVLKLTRPSSIRLILDSEARIEYPAASRVIPRASRSRLSCDPSSMRRTTDPGSPALTFASLPNICQGPKSATKTLRAVLARLRKRNRARDFVQEGARLRQQEGPRGRKDGGKIDQQAVREDLFRSAARASALASAVRIGNHGLRTAAVSLRPRIPGVPRMGTNG